MNRKHKVVLYNPDAVFYTMPLALLSVGSALDAKRYEVKIVDGRLAKERVLREIEDAIRLGISLSGRDLFRLSGQRGEVR